MVIRVLATDPAPERGYLLANETATFTFLSGICVLREKQLRSMQDVHKHRQLGLDQRPETVLQSRDDVLQWKRGTGNCLAGGWLQW